MKNKVFFNNSCNICRAEINHYKKHSNKDIEWVDVTNNNEAQQITSKSYEQLLKKNARYSRWEFNRRSRSISNYLEKYS